MALVYMWMERPSMSQHHRDDLRRYCPANFYSPYPRAQQNVTHSILPKGLTRQSALILACVRANRNIRCFIYDARNGRASWL